MSKKTDVDSEISELTEELRLLTLQTVKIATRIQELHNSRTKRQDKKAESKRPLQVGDRVKVLNNHNGQRGTTGRLINVTAAQVRILPDNGEKSFARYKNNVERIFTPKRDDSKLTGSW